MYYKKKQEKKVDGGWVGLGFIDRKCTGGSVGKKSGAMIDYLLLWN
jgi:hypothetical protein